MQNWQNFDIELFDHDTVGDVESVNVRVVRSPAGVQRDPVQITLPNSLRTAADALAKSDMTLADTVALGQALAAVLLPDQAADLFDNSRAQLAADEGLRLRIELRSLALADLPWEYVYRHPADADEHTPERGFLALDRTLSVVRFEPVAQPARDLAPLVGAPLEIAMLLANPRIPGWNSLDLEREEKSVKAALQEETDVALSVHRNATDRALNDVLDARPHVLHFSGHGRFKMRPGETFGTYVGEGQLMFEAPDGRPDPLSARELAAKVRGAGVRLAVLNCCESGRRDSLNPFTGVAPTLVREGVPAVVAMQYNIRDAHAERFARRLYHNLAEHQSIDAAVTAARVAMFGVDGRFDRDWGIPVLYLRSEQSVLFPDEAAPQPAAQPPIGKLGLINLALSAVLVFVLAFLYLRHIEPRLPLGKIVGGVLIAALVTALAYLTTVAGDTLRPLLLRLLGKRRALGALLGAIAAIAATLVLLPAPVAVRVLPGKNLITLLPAADLANPVSTYSLTVDGGGRAAVAVDFRKSGVTLAGSRSLATRLGARYADVAAGHMDDYLLENDLDGRREQYLGLWQPEPSPLGMRSFAKSASLRLTLAHEDGTPLACTALAPATLASDMTVIFLENDDECQ